MQRGDHSRRGRYLGVDLGGSSTRAHLIDGVAAPREWHLPGGNVAIDRDAAHDILLPLLREARPDAACLGLAGARTAPAAAASLQADLTAEGFPVTIVTDAELSLAAAFGPDADGIVLCAGTGSVAVVRVTGAIDLVGGHGYLIDDAGSAYDIGRRIVAAALRERDRGSDALVRELEGVLGEQLGDFLTRVYRRPAERSHLALLARSVPGLTHPAALDVLDAAAESLIDLVRTAQERFGPLPVRLMGGVFGAARIADRLERECGASRAETRPEVAAARLAASGAAP